tara:strand:+ start:1032 stop:1355 length:324 start_codon:yes stop_codon:yes gene_type:complete
MDYCLKIEKTIYLKKKLKIHLQINNRKDSKKLWEIINRVVVYENCTWVTFLLFRFIPYFNEIKEIYKEEVAILKMKPLLIKYINWRLWNPDNGFRFIELKNKWYEQF